MPSLTEEAADHLRSLLGESGTLWVGAEPVGRRGFRYVLEVRQPHELREADEAPRTVSCGVPLMMDPKSESLLAGARIDYAAEEGLHIDNPGAVTPMAFGGSPRPRTRLTMKLATPAA